VGEALAVIRDFFERFNEGDRERLIALCDPEIELRDVPEIPGSDVYRGRDGIRRWLGVIADALDEIRFEIGEEIESGDGVVVESIVTAVGRGSGLESSTTFWTLWRVRGGLVAYHHGYMRREDAVRALQEGGVPG
jgi:ketosteroid isomerase-like protein